MSSLTLPSQATEPVHATEPVQAPFPSMSKETAKLYKHYMKKREKRLIDYTKCTDHFMDCPYTEDFSKYLNHFSSTAAPLMDITFPSNCDFADTEFTWGDIVFNGLTYYIGPLNGEPEHYRLRIYSKSLSEVVIHMTRLQESPAWKFQHSKPESRSIYPGDAPVKPKLGARETRDGLVCYIRKDMATAFYGFFKNLAAVSR